MPLNVTATRPSQHSPQARTHHTISNRNLELPTHASARSLPPSMASLASCATTSPMTSFAPRTSAAAPSRRSSRASISSRWRRTSSCSSAFCACVVCRRALSCDVCCVRAGRRWAARIRSGGRRCGLVEEVSAEDFAVRVANGGGRRAYGVGSGSDEDVLLCAASPITPSSSLSFGTTCLCTRILSNSFYTSQLSLVSRPLPPLQPPSSFKLTSHFSASFSTICACTCLSTPSARRATVG